MDLKTIIIKKALGKQGTERQIYGFYLKYITVQIELHRLSNKIKLKIKDSGKHQRNSHHC